MLNVRVSAAAIVVLLAGAMAISPSTAKAQSSQPFVDPEFVVPEKLETADFRLRMLTVNDVVKDFDAVVSSTEYLAGVFPGSSWPKGLTLEQNLIDLGWHQKEFQRRNSFAYTVVTLDESRVLGCVYIDPTRKRGYDAEVYLWAREAEIGSPSDEGLFEAVQDWLAEEWPFENVGFPGREIDWEAWGAIPDERR